MADIVCAGQCWHWFNPLKAAKEFARIVKPCGHVVVAHFDWLPLPGSVPWERVLKKGVKHDSADSILHLRPGDGIDVHSRLRPL